MTNQQITEKIEKRLTELYGRLHLHPERAEQWQQEIDLWGLVLQKGKNYSFQEVYLCLARRTHQWHVVCKNQGLEPQDYVARARALNSLSQWAFGEIDCSL